MKNIAVDSETVRLWLVLQLNCPQSNKNWHL